MPAPKRVVLGCGFGSALCATGSEISTGFRAVLVDATLKQAMHVLAKRGASCVTHQHVRREEVVTFAYQLGVIVVVLLDSGGVCGVQRNPMGTHARATATAYLTRDT